ncbi:MAG: hypothetical protein CHACPFDD_04183 [Phycisphaerae bacterium]|nr:hypothetical protein [Phycisphaerae bacterium]
MSLNASSNQPIRALFGGVVQQVFMVDVGLCDPGVTDYLSDMLADFLHVDRIYRLHTVTGEPIREIQRMHSDAYLGPDIEPAARNRLIHKYIGDFALFWAGVFPEQLTRRHGPDLLREYLLRGKRSYHIASELSRPDTHPPSDLLRNLGEHFEFCVHGLHLVRDNLHQITVPPPPAS